MLIRTIISLAMTAVLFTGPASFASRSCILSSAPAQQGCKPDCCANKACCATSNEHKSSSAQPLAKTDSNCKVSGTSIASFSAIAPSAESGSQRFVLFTAASDAHSPPTLALICIRLI
jgi:hypothetical protein